MRPEELKDLVARMTEELDHREEARDAAIHIGRQIIKASKRVISSIHGGEPDGKALKELRTAHKDLRDALEGWPELLQSNTVNNSLQEYAEAEVLHRIIGEGDLPTHEDLDLGPVPYLLGLADVIGELRRMVLDNLRREEFETAERLLAHMDTIFDAINTLSYSSDVIPIRRKQDVCRGILEKTRGELTVAVSMARSV